MAIGKDKFKNPFPGLRPFEPDDAHLFFGRDGQSDHLLGKLSRTRFVAVVGTSGSGKSSLVRAGLLPALREGITVTGWDWRVAVMRPGNDPMGNLSRALVSTLQKGTDTEPEEREIYPALCETILRRSSNGLIDAARWLRSIERPTEAEKSSQNIEQWPRANLLVVADQFEELFRYKQEATDRQTKDVAAEFVKLLLMAAEQPEAPIYVILTMRSEYLGDCAQFLGLPEAINKGQYLIPRMTRNERRAAIEGPIGVRHGKIGQFLVNRLLNDAGDDPENLPILQHALMRTWDEWRKSGEEALDLQHYYATGGMTSALSRHGDEVYESLPTVRSKEIARKLFTCLVEKDAKGRSVRRPTSLGEICQIISGSPNHKGSGRELTEVAAEVIPVINVFRSYGVSFLTPPPRTGLDEKKPEIVIDISHESLINGWQKLRDWAVKETASAGIYQRLAETALLYEVGQAGYYRGRELKIASAWKENFAPSRAWAIRYHPAYDKALDFLRNSKRQRITTLTMVYLIILTTIVSGIIYIGALRNRSRSEELAANSESASDPQESLRLAVEAVRTYQTEHAVAALRNSLFEYSARTTIQPVQEGEALYGVVSAALSPSGQFVITVNRDEKAHIWRVNGEESAVSQVDVIEPKIGFLTSVTFDPTGQKIILTGADKRAVVWSIEKGSGRATGRLAELTGHTGTVNRAAFSPDGQYVVTAASDRTARIWKLTEGGGQQVAVLWHEVAEPFNDSPSIWVKSAVFNPVNPRYVLTASWDGTVRMWLWDESTGKAQQRAISFVGTNGVNNAVFSSDGKYILTAGNSGSSVVLEWNSSQNNFSKTIARLVHGQPVFDAAFDPQDEHNVVTACADGVVRRWQWSDASIGSDNRDKAPYKPDMLGTKADMVNTKNAQLIGTRREYSDWVAGVSFSKEGGYVLTTGYDGTSSIWRDIRGQKKLERYLDAYSQPVLALGFSKDGKQFLTGGRSDHTLRLWDFATGRQIGDSFDAGGEVSDVVFSNDSSMIALANSDGYVYLLNNSGDLNVLVTLKSLEGIGARVAMSPNGQYLVAGLNGGAMDILQQTASNKHVTGTQQARIGTLKATSKLNSVAISSDGARLVTGSIGGTVDVWALADKSLAKSWQLSASVRDAVFSPDGKLVGAVCDDGSIAIIDINRENPLRHMAGYEGSTPTPVFRAAFSPDSRYLATAGYDNKVRVWDISTGKQLAEMLETSEDPKFSNPNQGSETARSNSFNSRPKLLNDIAFSPDGNYIAVARDDNRSVHFYVWAYFKDPAQLLKQAAKILGE